MGQNVWSSERADPVATTAPRRAGPLRSQGLTSSSPRKPQGQRRQRGREQKLRSRVRVVLDVQHRGSVAAGEARDRARLRSFLRPIFGTDGAPQGAVLPMGQWPPPTVALVENQTCAIASACRQLDVSAGELTGAQG